MEERAGMVRATVSIRLGMGTYIAVMVWHWCGVENIF